jgi:hypothetical protein
MLAAACRAYIDAITPLILTAAIAFRQPLRLRATLILAITPLHFDYATPLMLLIAITPLTFI